RGNALERLGRRDDVGGEGKQPGRKKKESVQGYLRVVLRLGGAGACAGATELFSIVRIGAGLSGRASPLAAHCGGQRINGTNRSEPFRTGAGSIIPRAAIGPRPRPGIRP